MFNYNHLELYLCNGLLDYAQFMPQVTLDMFLTLKIGCDMMFCKDFE